MAPTTLDPAFRREASTRYAADGYLALRALFDGAEVAAWRDECDLVFRLPGVVREGNLRARSRPSGSGRPVIDRLDPVTDLSPVLRQLAADPRVLEAAEIALGQRPVLFKDKLITKPPGTHGYGVHQDYMRWQFLPVPPDGVVTVAVAFDPASAESGAIEMFRGQHSRLLTAPGVVADPSEDDVGTENGQLIPLDPGDALLFHSLVPHRSGPNRSDRPRRMLFLTYSGRSWGDLYDDCYAHYRRAVLASLRPEERQRAFFA